MADMNEIMRALGRIEANSSNMQQQLADLRDEVQSDAEAARESRTGIHARLDAQVTQIAHLETTVAVAGQVDAQLRDEISGLSKKIDGEISPAVGEWRRMKTLGAGFSGLLLAVGITGAGVAIWAGDIAVTLVRRWLRID